VNDLSAIDIELVKTQTGF